VRFVRRDPHTIFLGSVRRSTARLAAAHSPSALTAMPG
jgi:hypothetical protein